MACGLSRMTARALPSGAESAGPTRRHGAAGWAERAAVSLRRLLRRTRVVPGAALGVDPSARRAVVRLITDDVVHQPYDMVVLAAGSVTRSFDIPGVPEHAHGMKTLAEAVAVRDHVLAQLDLAAATKDDQERRARLRFIVVGGGYAGTETAAYLQRLTLSGARRYPGLHPELVSWHLLDTAPRLMPELGERLGGRALALLRARGMDVSLGTSVAQATPEHVVLTDGRRLATRTLLWTAGVTASPLVSSLQADTVRGRLVVTPQLTVPGLEGLFALGDAAAVPDLVAGGSALCPPTAQHALRQGRSQATTSPPPCAVARCAPTGTGTWDWWSTSADWGRWRARWESRSAACPRRSWRADTTCWHCPR